MYAGKIMIIFFLTLLTEILRSTRLVTSEIYILPTTEMFLTNVSRTLGKKLVKRVRAKAEIC